MEEKKVLLTVEWFEGYVVNRPSKKIKSPYLADVKVPEENNEIILCHSPSLGCCGMVQTDKKVLLTKIKSEKAQSKYTVDFSYHGNTLVGINPNFGNKFARICFERQLINYFPAFSFIKQEHSLENS